MKKEDINAMNLANVVEQTFRKCLFAVNAEDASEKSMVIVSGITRNFGFDAQKVADNSEIIHDILDMLPVSFEDGDSLENIGNTKDGEEWTGIYTPKELVYVLGAVVNRMRIVTPKGEGNEYPRVKLYERKTETIN